MASPFGAAFFSISLPRASLRAHTTTWCAFACETQCRCLADTGCAARDDGDSVLKSFHGYLFLDEFFVVFEFGGARDALFAGSIEQQAFDCTDVFFGVYVDYFEFGCIFLPGEDGCTERHLLREIDGALSREEHSEDLREYGGRKESVHDGTAERGLAANSGSRWIGFLSPVISAKAITPSCV